MYNFSVPNCVHQIILFRDDMKPFAFFLSIFFLQGCFYNRPDYPEDWARLATDTGCPDLNGWYRDKGRTYGGVRYQPSIYLILLGGAIGKMDDAEFIKISQSDDELLVQAYSADKSLMRSKSFHIGSTTCSNGFLTLNVPKTEKFESAEGVVAYEWEGHGLSKTEDEALILRISSGDVGIVFVIPIAATDRIWGRFEPVPSEN